MLSKALIYCVLLFEYGPSQCIPSEYVLHESSDYSTYVLINHQKGGVNWDEAQAYCQNCVTTSLATILSSDDNLDVIGLLDEFKSTAGTENNLWIGWRSYSKDKHYIWAPCDNTNCVANMGWECAATDEVNATWHESEGSFDSKVCGFLQSSSEKWKDKACTSSLDFICNAPGQKYDPLSLNNCGPPSLSPTTSPTKYPTVDPSTDPTNLPTIYPTSNPSLSPTANPTTHPTAEPALSPTNVPSISPSSDPSIFPSTIPSSAPSNVPSTSPTGNPFSEMMVFQNTNHSPTSYGKDAVENKDEQTKFYFNWWIWAVAFALVCFLFVLFGFYHCFRIKASKKLKKDMQNLTESNGLNCQIGEFNTPSTEFVVGKQHLHSISNDVDEIDINEMPAIKQSVSTIKGDKTEKVFEVLDNRSHSGSFVIQSEETPGTDIGQTDL